MKKIKFSESKILEVIQEQAQGAKVADICRKHGISEPTFYNWKSRYSGMTLSELKRLKELEYENTRLRKLVANMSLELDMTKDLLGKNF